MKLSSRDRRALVLLAAGVVLILAWRASQMRRADTVEVTGGTIEAGEQRLFRLRTGLLSLPRKEAFAGRALDQLAEREKGLIRGETPEQAQAQLLEIARRLGKGENLDVRGGELGPIQQLGDDYGEVSVAITFDCAIEQLVNFLAALSAEPSLIATNEVQLNLADAKSKRLRARVVLAGVVDRRLVPRQREARL